MTQRNMWRGALALSLLLSAGGLAGCTTNPATGESMLSLMSPQDEQKVGDQEHPKLVEEFGGEYQSPELTRYVDSVGQLLARTSELPDQKFSFTVLDSDIVNAFALPGGYVHVSRGLLALANSEAEVAGVMAHEIGHVTARHSAQRYNQTMGANILSAILGIGLGSVGQQIGSAASSYYLASYSQDQEFQADSLGVRYLRRAGYDVQAMADFLASLRAQSQLEAEVAGLPPGTVDASDIMASHPRTLDRVQRAMAEAGGGAPVKDPMDGRDVYLRKIHGMIYGDSPEQGYARGTRFTHPLLRFAFDVPQGFRLVNGATAVQARGPQGAGILFDMKKVGAGGMASYLASVWARGANLQQVDTISVNGMEAATAQFRGSNGSEVRDVRLVAIRFDAEQVARMVFLTAPQQTASLSEALRTTTYSFRKLTAAQAAAVKPLRVAVTRVGAGDTVDRLAARMAFPDRQVERFRVLNGLQPNEGLKAGQLVKIVVEGDVGQQPS
ncbi:MAG TPA: M48 family metalloprotease [Alphaproteobacteria bacterium]|jgi:predicted Zn-dependent protease